MKIINVKQMSVSLNEVLTRIDFIESHIENIRRSYANNDEKQANEIKKFLIQENLYYLNTPDIDKYKILIDSLLRSSKLKKTDTDTSLTLQKIITDYEKKLLVL